MAENRFSRRTLLKSGAVLATVGTLAFELEHKLVGKHLLTSLSSGLQDTISWPPNQLLPTFSQPTSLDVATIIGLPEDQQLLFSAFQGLVNRHKPEIYLLQEDEEGRLTWLEEMGIPYRFLSSPWELFAIHPGVARSIVLYDLALPDTINVASTMASITNSLVCSESLANAAIEATGLLISTSFVDRFSDKFEAYKWAINSLLPQCTKRALVGLLPMLPMSTPPVELVPYFGEVFPQYTPQENLEPNVVNAYFRDFATAIKAFTFSLSPQIPEELELFNEILFHFDPMSAYLGWFPNGANGGEVSGVTLLSEHQLPVCASDDFVNMSVTSGLRATITSPPLPPVPLLQNKIYVTLTFTEGDNLEYCEHHMRVLFDDPSRGSTPLNWSISPLLFDCAPILMNYYYSNASSNDCFIGGPSGSGYMFPSCWPSNLIEAYINATADYMAKTGLTCIYSLNHPQGTALDMPTNVASAYATIPNLNGILNDWTSNPTVEIASGTLPIVSGQLASTPTELTNFLNGAKNNFSGNGPIFLSLGALSWNLTPSEVVPILLGLDSSIYSVVRVDHFFSLI
ncbi:MAG: hypothetical protein HKL80_04070 [Acidimicrobiales bacterium]|nr:hypothetical protein [Acidimicrobiales bacterium]